MLSVPPPGARTRGEIGMRKCFITCGTWHRVKLVLQCMSQYSLDSIRPRRLFYRKPIYGASLISEIELISLYNEIDCFEESASIFTRRTLPSVRRLSIIYFRVVSTL